MGDVANLLTGLNLSPVNTLLLVALILVLKYVVTQVDRRIAAIEDAIKSHTKSISWIKGQLGADECDDE